MKIYYQDAEIVVVEKVYGVSSQESNGENMISLLKNELGGEIYCVHRLDTQTTGVMVYAKTKEASAFLSREIASGKMHKEYLLQRLERARNAPTAFLPVLRPTANSASIAGIPTTNTLKRNTSKKAAPPCLPAI